MRALWFSPPVSRGRACRAALQPQEPPTASPRMFWHDPAMYSRRSFESNQEPLKLHHQLIWRFVEAYA